MILPGGEKSILYRDAYLGPEEQYGYKLQGFGFHHKMYSCLGGLPQIAFPVGEQFIYSRVSNTLVPEPVSLIIVGPAGKLRLIHPGKLFLTFAKAQTTT